MEQCELRVGQDSSIMEEYWSNRMAILNIKGFPDDLYEQLRKRAKHDHRSISQEVIHLLAEAVQARRQRSILELRGLGKSVWSEVDATEYVARERDSWD